MPEPLNSGQSRLRRLVTRVNVGVRRGELPLRPKPWKGMNLMKVEALYAGGRLQFLKPVALRDARVKVVVEIPDDAVATSDLYAGLDQETLAMIAALDAIRNAPIPADYADADEVSEKIAPRFAAFALRKDI